MNYGPEEEDKERGEESQSVDAKYPEQTPARFFDMECTDGSVVFAEKELHTFARQFTVLHPMIFGGGPWAERAVHTGIFKKYDCSTMDVCEMKRILLSKMRGNLGTSFDSAYYASERLGGCEEIYTFYHKHLRILKTPDQDVDHMYDWVTNHAKDSGASLNAWLKQHAKKGYACCGSDGNLLHMRRPKAYIDRNPESPLDDTHGLFTWKVCIMEWEYNGARSTNQSVDALEKQGYAYVGWERVGASDITLRFRRPRNPRKTRWQKKPLPTGRAFFELSGVRKFE